MSRQAILYPVSSDGLKVWSIILSKWLTAWWKAEAELGSLICYCSNFI